MATPATMVELVLAELEDGDAWAPATVLQVAGGMRRFARFLERGHGVAHLDEVTEAMVRSFVDAPSRAGAVPSGPVRYQRRNAVRLLFRIARRLGLATGDPSIDVQLPAWAEGSFRPLELHEVELCRAISLGDPRLQRPVAWALAEATARNGELGQVRRGDVDVDAGTVALSGTGSVDARAGILTHWGATQLRRHLASTPPDSDRPLLPSPVGRSIPRTKEHRVREVLDRAGLHHADGVKPNSVAAWIGRQVFDETGRLDLVAKRCGLRSLDAAARFIGWDWRAEE